MISGCFKSLLLIIVNFKNHFFFGISTLYSNWFLKSSIDTVKKYLNAKRLSIIRISFTTSLPKAIRSSRTTELLPPILISTHFPMLPFFAIRFVGFPTSSPRSPGFMHTHTPLLRRVLVHIKTTARLTFYTSSIKIEQKDMTHLTNNSMILEFLSENKEFNIYSVNFPSSICKNAIF